MKCISKGAHNDAAAISTRPSIVQTECCCMHWLGGLFIDEHQPSYTHKTSRRCMQARQLTSSSDMATSHVMFLGSYTSLTQLIKSWTSAALWKGWTAALEGAASEEPASMLRASAQADAAETKFYNTWFS